MMHRAAMLTPYILGCWLASLFSTASTASVAGSGFLRRGSVLRESAAGSQWRVAEEAFLGWLGKKQGIPYGCNCMGTTGGKCNGGGGGTPFPPGTTTMPAPAQPPIPPPPPPLPLPGPPPPLPLGPAKPLPGLPGLPGITLDTLPTLGPPPLYRMTPPPTFAPNLFSGAGGIYGYGRVTTPPPPTLPPATTPAWQETPFGLVAGTTRSPFMAFTTTYPHAAPAPAPAPVMFRPVQFAPPVQFGVALAQKQAASWNPLSLLHRTVSGHSQQQAAAQPCNCPCEDWNSASGVDRGFDSVMMR